MTMIAYDRLPVLVEGVRTPFLDSAGAYSPLMSYELGAKAIAGLVQKSAVDTGKLGLVVMGTVLHEINTTNVARECMLAAGLPSTIPAYTVAMAGISPSVGVANICDMIALGRMDMGIAGGTENFSDVPVRLSQNVRRSLMKIRQSRSTRDRLAVLGSLRPRDLLLDVPTSSDFTTKLTMGEACEAMVRKFGMTREASDAFAAASHARAVAATDAGFYREQILPVTVAGMTVTEDNTARRDTTPETLARLKPVFDRESGIITAGNSSRFSDGAGAVLLSSMGAARAAGHAVKAVIRDYQFAGVDSLEQEMLLGPAMTIPRLLQRNGLNFADVDAWEIHEAFATQVLINRACLASEAFVAERFGTGFPHGEIPLEKLNICGGSLSMGNPFAATGVRLLMTAAQRLLRFNQRYAVISTCAGGGLGAAFLLENPDFVKA
ncbi:acetyl-CoA acyltransferase/acetyl-CoA acyltransferase [Fluviicoccus keumensis]|uniref:Acetyl-CoA acyltransferase/acetyl-CoA acyltransferase n=1 Tax=Fluviicoccus keumensis TaxID=1435465 RepID=A0A4Q7Z5U4_9GAMM|nr:thiolase family protein [Fluviicoccus keumensis]RZU45083.1 acetyl-CoA acyltransferase/acetyl-CoA acyltransferase [Fluviicoccus keumensis]